MCADHWLKLREGVKSRGLWHLVAKSGEDAHARLLEEIDGTAKVEGYDPLMAANIMITGEALKQGGLTLLVQDENGKERCPLCEVDKNGKGQTNADSWINGCLDSVLEYCRDNGLTPKVQ